MKNKLLTVTLSTREWKHIIGSLDVDYSEVSNCNPAELSNEIIEKVLPELYEKDQDLPEAWIKYCEELKTSPSISQVLVYLDEIGWSSLVDSRHKEKLREDILQKYPSIQNDTLQQVLKIMIVD